MAEEIELMTVNNIQNRVYIIRGQQVMLDFDLAEIYGYEVKKMNQQVKRNIERFPDDFMFQLNREEVEFVKSQFVTSRNINMFEGQGGGTRKLPYAFTEQRIYMLATVLKGELAEQQSIFIMRAFREMRHYIMQNQQFVTQSEMRLVAAKVSEISVQNADMFDWRKRADKKFEIIQQSIDTINENFVSDKDFKNFYVDCSSSFNYLQKDTAKRIIKTYGADKVLFGTDYPMWSPEDELKYFLLLGLDEREIMSILNINAKKLFGVKINE